MAPRASLLLLIALALFLIITPARASDEAAPPDASAAAAAAADAAADARPPPPPALERAELAKLKVKQLHEMLRARGQKCEGCAEKEDLVARVLEVQHLPTLTATPRPPPPPPEEGGAAWPEDGAFPDTPGFDFAKIKQNLFRGQRRIEKVVKKMKKMGLDTSGIDAKSLGGLADSMALTDDQLMSVLMSIAKGPPPAPAPAPPAEEGAAPAAAEEGGAPAAGGNEEAGAAPAAEVREEF